MKREKSRHIQSKFGEQMESEKMKAHDYEIKTERLLLRPMTIADADAVWKWVSDERVTNRQVSFIIAKELWVTMTNSMIWKN